MNDHILMIDDDRMVMNVYVTALQRRQFRVTLFSGEHCVDQAIQFLKESSNQVDLAVVDIMMPPGEAFRSRDTDQGMRTGVFLLEKLKADCPSLPILVLTNVQNEETLSLVRRAAPEVKILRKPHCLPFELVEAVQNRLAESK